MGKKRIGTRKGGMPPRVVTTRIPGPMDVPVRSLSIMASYIFFRSNHACGGMRIPSRIGAGHHAKVLKMARPDGRQVTPRNQKKGRGANDEETLLR